MASFRINGFEGAEKMFDELYNSRKLGVKALEAAAPILVKETRKVIQENGSGEKLARSFEATKTKENRYGAFLTVQPVGMAADGTEWVRRAAFEEYGTVWPRKAEDAAKIHHPKQAGLPKNPRVPWRQKAINAAREKCEGAMREVVYSEIDRAWGALM